MTHGSLFSGIGGFDLAAEWMGWENIFHCEWNPFGQKVLKHYWPNAISYENICTTDFTVHRGKVDIITGGFPCQPYSTAGKRLGKADERHLFPEMLRCIKEIKPKWIIGENVRGLINWNGGVVFDEVCNDLESQGYEVSTFLIPAAGVNAPHRRDRVWFIAKNATNTTGDGFWECTKTGQIRRETDDAKEKRDKPALSIKTNGYGFKPNWENFPTVSPICNGDDGLSKRLDGITFSKWRKESIKAGGNAIVPQVAYQIFKTIELYERSRITEKDR
jgi:DNA (cytosine-5)-methyltransferase 1